MTSVPTKDIHIHMTSDDQEHQQKFAASAKMSANHDIYLISQNRELSDKLDTMRTELTDLKSEMAEAEWENQKQKEAIRYMKGIIDNFREISNLQDDMNSLNFFYLVKSKNLLESVEFCYLLVSVAAAMFYMWYFFTNFFGEVQYIAAAKYFVYAIGISFQGVAFSNSMISYIRPDRETDDKIKRYAARIRQLKNSQFFLQEYVDAV